MSFATVAVLEQFVVYAEDCLEELAGEGEVEFGVFANEFCDEGEHVKHTELEVLVIGLVLPR